MKNRKRETGNAKQANGERGRGSRFANFEFPVLSFLFFILLSAVGLR